MRVWLSGIRVPVAVSWPGVIPSGVVTNYTMAFWDVMPTLADVFDIPASAMPGDIDGISVLPVWLNTGSPPDHPPLYFEFCTQHTAADMAANSPATVTAPDAAPTNNGRVVAGDGGPATWGHAVVMGRYKAVSFAVGAPYQVQPGVTTRCIFVGVPLCWPATKVEAETEGREREWGCMCVSVWDMIRCSDSLFR